MSETLYESFVYEYEFVLASVLNDMIVHCHKSSARLIEFYIVKIELTDNLSTSKFIK